ncbi:MAG: aldehyde dehydrogenase [Eubacteriales bacterium]|nr:aldehyde dehydrogenase [Eubacteriales bacterium]
MSRKTEIYNLFEDARKYLKSKKTLDPEFRIKMLKRLRTTLKRYESAIYRALQTDLNKCEQEALMTEVSVVFTEIDYVLKNIRVWTKPRPCRPSMVQMPGKVRVYDEPYGVVLIISPWNYPFQLTLLPLIGAIAAGNCVILKPSAYSRHTTAVLEKICAEAFPRGFVSCVTGGREENVDLLDLPFDYIFFTGSPAVGKIVAKKAAEHLTPVTLELGGKSPVIIDETADISKTARRVAFGKLLNAGQTCVAPDYVYVHKRVKPRFISELTAQFDIISAGGDYADTCYPRIINEKHFERLAAMLEEADIVYGGKIDAAKRRIYPTILENAPADSTLMQTEIFGPLLPLIEFEDVETVFMALAEKAKPLAAYLFTSDDELAERFIREMPFGGGCINDCVMQVATHFAPFGGVGNSGMGAYHGYATYKTFSHGKTVLHKPWKMDNMMRHHPYTDKKLGLLKALL